MPQPIPLSRSETIWTFGAMKALPADTGTNPAGLPFAKPVKPKRLGDTQVSADWVNLGHGRYSPSRHLYNPKDDAEERQQLAHIGHMKGPDFIASKKMHAANRNASLTKFGEAMSKLIRSQHPKSLEAVHGGSAPLLSHLIGNGQLDIKKLHALHGEVKRLTSDHPEISRLIGEAKSHLGNAVSHHESHAIDDYYHNRLKKSAVDIGTQQQREHGRHADAAVAAGEIGQQFDTPDATEETERIKAKLSTHKQFRSLLKEFKDRDHGMHPTHLDDEFDKVNEENPKLQPQAAYAMALERLHDKGIRSKKLPDGVEAREPAPEKRTPFLQRPTEEEDPIAQAQGELKSGVMERAEDLKKAHHEQNWPHNDLHKKFWEGSETGGHGMSRNKIANLIVNGDAHSLERAGLPFDRMIHALAADNPHIEDYLHSRMEKEGHNNITDAAHGVLAEGRKKPISHAAVVKRAKELLQEEAASAHKGSKSDEPSEIPFQRDGVWSW